MDRLAHDPAQKFWHESYTILSKLLKAHLSLKSQSQFLP